MKLYKSSSYIRVILMVALALCCFAPATWARSSSRGFPSICRKPPPRSEGVCTVEIEGFYFDARANDCLMYTVGGCHPFFPGQSFGSRQDCISTCIHGTRSLSNEYFSK